MLRRRRWAPHLCSGAHVGVCWWLSLQGDVWWQSCPKHRSRVHVRNLLKSKQSLAHAAAAPNPVLCCHKFSVIILMLVWIGCAARLPFLPVGNSVSLLLSHWTPQHWCTTYLPEWYELLTKKKEKKKKSNFSICQRNEAAQQKSSLDCFEKKLSAGLWHTRHKLNHN